MGMLALSLGIRRGINQHAMEQGDIKVLSKPRQYIGPKTGTGKAARHGALMPRQGKARWRPDDIENGTNNGIEQVVTNAELWYKVAHLEALVGVTDEDDQDLSLSKNRNKDKVKEYKKFDKECVVEDNGKGKEKLDVGTPKGKVKTSKFVGYFLSDVPHMERDCPKRAKLVNALPTKNEEEAQPNEQLMGFLSPLCVLNK
ncbi:hypothetical protein HAX54_018824, partial [Datura stramonium]|nr:hypothetical protein [Datura stramonium]